MGTFIASVIDHLILPAQVRLPPNHERWNASHGESVPSPVPIRLLIDTGAKRTILIPGIFRHLRPTPGWPVHLVTPSGSGRTDLFWACLEFPGTPLAPFPEVLVARHPMPPPLAQFHGVFGPDLLSRMHSF